MQSNDFGNIHSANRLLSSALGRRRLLKGAGITLTGAGAALLFGCGDDDGPGKSLDPNAPPEVTTIRIPHEYAICTAPQYVARDFLAEEGFTDVQYVSISRLSAINAGLADGSFDISLNFIAPVLVGIDQGEPLLVLGSVHVGCFELFAQDGIELDGLAGKTIAIGQASAVAADFAFMTSILKFVGVDPGDKLVARSRDQMLNQFTNGSIDAVLVYPPLSQQLRTFKVGHVILNGHVDRPYVNYFCCSIVARRAWAEANPSAARRAVRAILRGADLCAQEPERAARYLFEHGFVGTYEYALDAMNSLPYDVWRSSEPEDTMRFYANRLFEAGVLKKTADDLIARGSDWRYFNELRQEMAFAPGFEISPRAAQFGCVIDASGALIRSPGIEREARA